MYIMHTYYSNEDEVMTSLDDIHNVGTLVQITELHDTGEQMSMIIQGHRRYLTTSLSIDY